MKPFDLQAAKSGAPIVTRDGREAKFVTHIPEASEGFRVVWMQGGIVGCSYENGKLGENIDSRHDLFMKPQEKTVFVNLMRREVAGEYEHHYSIHPTANKALAIAGNVIGTKILAIAVPIEIEE